MRCKLKVIFAERDIVQREFAGKIGMTPSALNAIVRGKSIPNLHNAYRIAKELGLSVYDIWEEGKVD